MGYKKYILSKVYQLFIFAAGFGKRLLPLTINCPKALITIKDKPVLKIILDHYYRICPPKSVIINTHYLANKIRSFIVKNPQYKLIESFEKDEILGTGKGLINAASKLDTSYFWVHNSDIICDFNIQTIIDFHQKNKSLVTLLVNSAFTNSPIIIDQNSKVVGFRKMSVIELKQKKLMAKNFCGIHLISQKLLKLVNISKTPFSIIDLYRLLIEEGVKILSWDLNDNYWIDIGTPENLQSARQKYYDF